MNKTTKIVSSGAGIFLLLFGSQLAYGYGFGGRGGSIGSRGGHGGEFQGSAYRGDRYRPGELQGHTVQEGYNAGRTALPTDAGFGGGEYRAGHARATGIRPGGVEAGGDYRGRRQADSVRAKRNESGRLRDRDIEGIAERPVANRTDPISSSIAAERGTAVRDSFRNYDMFDTNWFSEHPKATFALGWRAGRNHAWNTATWPYVSEWYEWPEDTEPYYYDYGNNITYEDDQVYSDGKPIATTDEYYDQAFKFTQSAPASDPNSTDWMPLGVFSLVCVNQSETNTVLQLAINKSGAIAGNAQSAADGTTLPILGAVDKKTQRVAWIVGSGKNRVYETGISNLTMDEAPILIHLGKNITQQWMLVRLKQPQ